MRPIHQLMIAVLLAISASATPPNIVWIIGDDLSPDLGCYGYREVETPHIDRLAEQGVRYTAAFATSPVCSPSRSALITGRYQTSIGTHQHRTPNKGFLPEGVRPVTQHLREAGYQCVNFKGQGANGKTDYNFRSRQSVFDGSELDLAKPFFMQVNFFEPHRPFKKLEGRVREGPAIPPQYPEHPVVRSDWTAYLEHIERLDGKVGRFLAWLEGSGQAENTVVFFFGDHGRPHVWDKQWLYDGGIRVPLIVRWPGMIAAGGSEDRLVSLLDVSAETLKLAGQDIPDGFHGRAFLGKAAERSELFAARDRCGDAYERIRCVRTKRFKYIRNFYPELPYWQTSRYKLTGYPVLDVLKTMHEAGELSPSQARFFADTKPAEELYDLGADPSETNNLVSDPAHLETLERLRSKLDNWIAESGDKGAKPESIENYKAAVAGSTKHFKKKFKPDGWHQRSEAIRAKLVERNLRPTSVE